MGSFVKQMPNDEAFWSGLVETNMRLGWEQCLVPSGNLEPEAAQSLADRLRVRLEVTDEGYVFKNAEIWPPPEREINQHHSVGSTSKGV